MRSCPAINTDVHNPSHLDLNTIVRPVAFTLHGLSDRSYYSAYDPGFTAFTSNPLTTATISCTSRPPIHPSTMVVRLHKLLPHRIRRRIHHTLCRIPYYCQYVSKRRLKKRQKHLPKPLAPRMEHQNLSSIAINPSTNVNCLFLTMLPLEIRLQVYTEVFSDPKFSNCVTVHNRGHLHTFSLCCCHPVR